MQNNNLLFDWQKIQLKEICSNIYSGGTPSTKDESYWNGNILWLSSGEIKKRYIISSNQKITQKGVDNSSTKLARENDVLIASAGQGYTRGNVAFCLIDTYINQSLISLRTDKRICSEKFLFFNLMDRYDELRNLSDSNSSRGSLTCEMMGKLPIYLPPLPTQQKIAAILSAYDDLIENNTRRIKILEEMAQAIYHEWFVNFRFPGHEGVQMVESELGLVPEGWEIVKIPDAVIINPRIALSKEGIKPFLSMGCLSENTMNVQTIEYREGNSGSKFQNCDTLFARITPCLENGKTVFVQFLPTDSDIAFGSTEFIVLRSKTLTPEFVYLLSRTESFRDNAIKSMSGATGRQRVQEECFKKYLIAHPDMITLNAFDEVIKPIFQSVYTLSLKNTNLRRTRDLLLPKLISGEIDVSELNIRIPEAEA